MNSSGHLVAVYVSIAKVSACYVAFVHIVLWHNAVDFVVAFLFKSDNAGNTMPVLSN